MDIICPTPLLDSGDVFDVYVTRPLDYLAAAQFAHQSFVALGTEFPGKAFVPNVPGAQRANDKGFRTHYPEPLFEFLCYTEVFVFLLLSCGSHCFSSVFKRDGDVNNDGGIS